MIAPYLRTNRNASTLTNTLRSSKWNIQIINDQTRLDWKEASSWKKIIQFISNEGRVGVLRSDQVNDADSLPQFNISEP